ncbi:MAG: hypothetical protein GQ557_01475 [Mycoplasmataceae bacterium]|nr:hypothetical protein [Mycoplasmataceae bacterium]
MVVSPNIKSNTLKIAKGMTPIDTGNLRHNATNLRKVKSNSWTINYSSGDAYYIEILEDGVLNGKKLKGRSPRRFIERTSLEIAVYLKKHFEGKPKSDFQNGKMRQSKETMDDNTPRRLRHFESLNKIGNTKWR